MPDTEKKKKIKKIGVWCLYGLWVVFALLIGTTAGLINKGDALSAVVVDYFNPKDPVELFGSEELTLLILGTDEDRYVGGEGVERVAARSDMVLVAKLNFSEKRISGITIPRDTLAKVDGYSVRRINAFHSIGGKDLAEEAVEELLGLKVDRVVVVNYQVFKEMVDMLGGVEVDVPKTMKYDDNRGDLHIDLVAGRQTLSGEDAIGYVRYRGDGDFLRQKRQREFMLLFKEQALKNKLQASNLVNMTSDLTGNVFSNSELGFLFNWARGVSSERVNLGMLPVLDAENYDLIVDTNKLYDTLIKYELIKS